MPGLPAGYKIDDGHKTAPTAQIVPKPASSSLPPGYSVAPERTAADKSPAGGNPFIAPIRGVLKTSLDFWGGHGTGGRTASVVGKGLDYQQEAVIEKAFHKGSPDANMAALRKYLGIDHAYHNQGFQKIFGSNRYTQALDHFGQGIIDTALKNGTDPITYETLGTGLVRRAGVDVAGNAARAGFKALNATPFGRKLYEFANWGGKVSQTHGPQTTDFIRGAANMASNTGMVVQKRIVERFDRITQGLDGEQKVKLGKALNGEPGGLESLDSPKLQSAYRQLRVLTEMDYKFRVRAATTIAFRAATKDLSQADRDLLARALKAKKEPPIPAPTKRVKTPNPQAQDTADRSRAINAKAGIDPDRKARARYTFMPGNQADIEHAQTLNQRFHDILFHVEQATPKRADYMPGLHPFEETGGREARTIRTTDYHDPRFEQREDIQVTHPKQLVTGFNAMAANTGRQVERGMIHDALGNLLDDPEVAKLFERHLKATGNKRDDWQRIKDGWLAVVGYPRAATVSLTPRHGVNILDLLVANVGPKDAPQVLSDTMALAKKIYTAKDSKEYAALTQEGRQLGALSGNFLERKPFMQNIPGLRHWTAANNKLVWAIDEAAKQTYGKLIVARGEAQGLQAGGKAAARLVDYEHVSPLAEKLRYVSSFGTFRGSVPGAVGGALLRSPMRAAFYNRATGGAFYGGKPQPGQQGVTLYNPTADVGRGPMEYLRGTLSSPAQAAAVLGSEAASGSPGASFKTLGEELHDLPGAAAHGRLPQARRQAGYADEAALRHARYLNYGNPIDLRWLISAASAGIVEARTALEEMGYGQFRPQRGSLLQRAGKEAARQVLGVGIKP